MGIYGGEMFNLSIVSEQFLTKHICNCTNIVVAF